MSMVITICPRCEQDFMYDVNDIHLIRIVKGNLFKKDKKIVICQTCNSIEVIGELKDETQNKIENHYNTHPNSVQALKDYQPNRECHKNLIIECITNHLPQGITAFNMSEQLKIQLSTITARCNELKKDGKIVARTDIFSYRTKSAESIYVIGDGIKLKTIQKEDWIPVKEKLPIPFQNVLIRCKGVPRALTGYINEKKIWRIIWGSGFDLEDKERPVIFWCKIPTLPNKYKDDI